MDVRLTADQEAFIRHAIESGRVESPEDAVAEALALWEERERTRAEILFALESADQSLASGNGRTITPESMKEMAEVVKQKGRARLAAERPTHH